MYYLTAFIGIRVSYSGGEPFSGYAGTAVVSSLFILNAVVSLFRIGMLHNQDDRYSGYAALTAGAVITVGSVLFATGYQAAAAVLMKAVCPCILAASFCVMALIHIQRIRKCEKERISKELFKTCWMMSELFLLSVVCLCFLSSGGHSGNIVTLSAICVSALIQALHIWMALYDFYPTIWYDNKIKLNLRKKEQMDRIMRNYGEADGMVIRLTEYFEMKKPYLSPDLCLTEVAMYLMTNKTTLSRVIHHQMKMNFRELVNRYRIKEAISIYTDNMLLDMEELARLSGFRNNASFTNAFKINIGKTPGAWCKEYKEQRNGIWEKEVMEKTGTDVQCRKAEGGQRTLFATNRIDESNYLS